MNYVQHLRAQVLVLKWTITGSYLITIVYQRLLYRSQQVTYCIIGYVLLLVQDYIYICTLDLQYYLSYFLTLLSYLSYVPNTIGPNVSTLYLFLFWFWCLLPLSCTIATSQYDHVSIGSRQLDSISIKYSRFNRFFSTIQANYLDGRQAVNTVGITLASSRVCNILVSIILFKIPTVPYSPSDSYLPSLLLPWDQLCSSGCTYYQYLLPS